MRPTLGTRKPVNELTLQDIDSFRVWEFAADEEEVEGRDETWVRPLATRTVPKGMYSLSVACRFTFADGSQHSGIMGVTTADGGTEVDSGVVIGQGCYLVIPRLGFGRHEAQGGKFLAALGRTASAVFPIRYQLQVLVEGETQYRMGALE